MTRQSRRGSRQSHDCRAAAARALQQVAAGQSLNQVLPAALASVVPDDRALLQELCYGCLRLYPRLSALLDPMLDKPLRDKDGDVRALLLVGLYQLTEMRIPPHAAVSTTVDASAALGKSWARGLCNAILRRFQREESSLRESLDEAAAAAHPRWLYECLQSQWPAAAEQIIDANNQRPPMTLRVNTLRTDRTTYMSELEEAGLVARAGAISDSAIYLDSATDVDRLPGFGNGLCSVQDEAAQMAAPLLGAVSGDRVLDACAAPGGKSCHILEHCPGVAELVALDADAIRLERVAENAARLNLPIQCLVADAGNPPGDLAPAYFDRILVDAPCSASGVIRRHPDIKLLRRDSDPAGFAEQQIAILQGVWSLLRPGGTLLYVTCSILGEENDDVVDRFLTATADASAETLPVDWGVPTNRGRQLLPTANGPDGLFYARLHKAEPA
jgi:16S rRNA (cytosine967-C5)-methyltransferase